MKNTFLLQWELLRWQTQEGLCLRGLGILMTVIYKPIAQEASLNQQDNGTHENLSAAALWWNVAWGTEPGLYQAERGGSGQRAQAAAPPWNAGLCRQLTATPRARGGVVLAVD